MSVNVIRIKLVDGRGRTVSVLAKRTYFDDNGQVENTEKWGVESKPVSTKRPELPANEGRIPQAAVRRHGDRRYLEVPGLTLDMDKVGPVLDGIAASLGLIDPSGAVIVTDENAATITTDQLRRYVGS